MVTYTNWDTIESGGGSNPVSVADMDDINAGHTITLDCDMSGLSFLSPLTSILNGLKEKGYLSEEQKLEDLKDLKETSTLQETK